MYLQHNRDDSHTQLNRSRQLRELVGARAQYALLKDMGRDDVRIGWYKTVRQDDRVVSKFRQGKITWPNVREAREEGLFVKFDGETGWHAFKDLSNDELIECLRDVNEPIADIVELLLYEVLE